MIRASSISLWFGLAIVASLAFYRTTDNVQALELQLRDLNASIEAEQKTIHVLKAEWVYLANPARVETEARKHLTLRPTAPHQVARIDDLSEILPTRDEAMTSVAVNGTPIASVRTSLAAPPASQHVAAVTQKPHPVIAVASVDTGHINERMVMQHTIPAPASTAPAAPDVAAAPAAPTDAIGTLIRELGSHP